MELNITKYIIAQNQKMGNQVAHFSQQNSSQIKYLI